MKNIVFGVLSLVLGIMLLIAAFIMDLDLGPILGPAAASFGGGFTMVGFLILKNFFKKV